MKKTDETSLINIACSLLFAVFTFLYIYFFQDDMLFYAQHVLSEGVTAYNPLVGALVITFLAMLLSWLSSKLFTNNLSVVPALHHLPSALMIAALTDIHVVGKEDDSVFGKVWMVSVVIFILLLIVNGFFRQLSLEVRMRRPSDLMRSINTNIFALLVVVSLMVALGNTYEMNHLQLRGEMLLKQKRFEQASDVGKIQCMASDQFTMIRAYALGEMGEIGERFFESPVVGDANSLLPSKSNPLLILPSYDVYKFVGGIPSPGMDARECIRLLAKRNKLNGRARDYKYLACLLDRDLDGFVGYLKNDSVALDSLPKHYREALTLYNHLRTEPVIDFSSPEMDADFKDLQDIIKKNPNKVLRWTALRDSYVNTYWFYYYSKPQAN